MNEYISSYQKYQLFYGLKRSEVDVTIGKGDVKRVLFDGTCYKENSWEAKDELTIFECNDGDIGVYRVVPDGYSTYTYDPDETYSLYRGEQVNLSWIVRYVLDDDTRRMFGLGFDVELNTILDE